MLGKLVQGGHTYREKRILFFMHENLNLKQCKKNLKGLLYLRFRRWMLDCVRKREIDQIDLT